MDLEGVLSGRLTDISLRRNDVLVVSSVHDLEDRGGFTIGGEVARPGVYPYAAHTTVEDLIVQAGGNPQSVFFILFQTRRRILSAVLPRSMRIPLERMRLRSRRCTTS